MANSRPVDARGLSTLVLMLYKAAADPQLWPEFIARLNEQLGAEHGSLLVHRLAVDNTRHNEGMQLYQAGFDPIAFKLYNEHYGRFDPYAKGFFERKVSSEIGYCADLVDYDAMRRGEFYHDFLRPFDTFYLCWIAISSPGRATALSLARSEKRAPFGAEQLQVLALLTPHLRQALQISSRLVRAGALAASAKRTVEAFNIAALSIDAAGRVIHASPAAEVLLQQQTNLRINNGRLVVNDPAVQARLDLLIHEVTRTSTGVAFQEPCRHGKLIDVSGQRKVLDSAASGGAIRIEGLDSKAPLEVTVVPFRSDTLLQDDSPAALVFLGGIGGESGRLTKNFLRDLYHLTPAEINLAVKIGEGIDLQNAAQQLEITPGTARHRLKQIFQKTGVSRQTELVRLIIRFPQK